MKFDKNFNLYMESKHAQPELKDKKINEFLYHLVLTGSSPELNTKIRYKKVRKLHPFHKFQ
jgi:hypothetical protein